MVQAEIYNPFMSDLWKWAFDGVGGTVALTAIGWLVDLYRRRFKSSAPSDTVPAVPVDPPPSRFTRPTPDEMMKQVYALPPFQRTTAYDAFIGLKVRWLTVFSRLFEEPAHETKKKKQKQKQPGLKWIVVLKYYDPPYNVYDMHCYGISLDTYPQLKFMHDDELVIVSGTVTRFGYTTDLRDVTLEFTGKRAENR
jgi:hypothetical protein